MMKKSQNSMARPIEMFLYLFMTAPMISVPPVLPFPEKTSPNPDPQRNAPMMIDINGSLGKRGCPFKNHSKKDKEADRERTPKIVLMRNLKPNSCNDFIGKDESVESESVQERT